MPDKFLRMTPALYEYMVEHGARRDEALRRVEEETEALGDIAVMQTAPEQGALLTLLARAIGARRAIEVGTFTGYGAICIARGLAEGGTLVCCEIDDGWADTAERNLAMAGVEGNTDVRRGPALETLRSLPSEPAFDFAFVDADKIGYADYYEEVLRLLRPGGLCLLDNVLLSGRVLEPDEGDESAVAMERLNAAIAADERVDLAMIGVADGVTILSKR